MAFQVCGSPLARYEVYTLKYLHAAGENAKYADIKVVTRVREFTIEEKADGTPESVRPTITVGFIQRFFTSFVL